MVDIRIDGLDELKKQMLNISRSMGADNVEKINYNAAEIITEEVRRRAPEGPTKNLKSSPVTKQLKREYHGHPARAIAAIDRKKAPHAHLIEFGTSDRYTKGTGAYRGRVEERPFFRPAVDAKYNEAFDFLKNGLGDLIDRGVR